jgi:tripartite-type tricarboxylate transporter receptor subunit TctC
MMITDTSTGVTQIKGGKLRALAVSTSKRMGMLPEVPTIDEAGVKGYDMGYWFAAYVPAATPPAVVQRLNELLANGLKTAAAKAFFETSGGEPFATTPEALGRFQQAESLKWGKVIKAAGIEPE